MAVLVAIAIPVFSSRLEQSRETTDIANLRSAYAAGQVAALSGLEDGTKVSGGTSMMYFNPDDPDGLVDNEASAMSGQGTAVDGHANTDPLPDIVSYGTGIDVREHGIAVSWSDEGLSSVSFAS